jgi:excisionase family DNA binding protein
VSSVRDSIVGNVGSSFKHALIRFVEEIIPKRQSARYNDESARCRESLLLRIPDAANVLGVGRTTLCKLINDGDINVVHIGRAVRIPFAELKAFVARRQDNDSRW